MKPMKRAERAEREASERYVNWRAEHPDATPYDAWHTDGNAKYFHQIVADALADALADVPTAPTYVDGHRKQRPLTVEDLALSLFAVSQIGESRRGIGAGHVAKCFQVAFGVGCHKGKAGALLSALVNLGCAQQTANHSAGAHCRRYRFIHDADERRRLRHDPALRVRPRPMLRPPPTADAPTDDDPFA